MANVCVNFPGGVKCCICTAWECGNARDGEGKSNQSVVIFGEPNGFQWQLLQANNGCILISLC